MVLVLWNRALVTSNNAGFLWPTNECSILLHEPLKKSLGLQQKPVSDHCYKC